MSKIIYQSLQIPEMSRPTQTWKSELAEDNIDNVRMMDIDENMVSRTLPDPKAYRSMTRAALLASMDVATIKQKIDEFGFSPFEIGLYAAFENGPIDVASTIQIFQQAPTLYDEKFTEAFKKRRNPKMYLKQLPNLAAAQVGIFLNIQGPMNVFTHSKYASLQALEQAEWDLATKKVKTAVIVAANAFEDYFTVKRLHLEDSRTLCEGAAAVILSSQEQEMSVTKSTASDMGSYAQTDWKAKLSPDPNNYFGIADSLISVLRTN